MKRPFSWQLKSELISFKSPFIPSSRSLSYLALTEDTHVMEHFHLFQVSFMGDNKTERFFCWMCFLHCISLLPKLSWAKIFEFVEFWISTFETVFIVGTPDRENHNFQSHVLQRYFHKLGTHQGKLSNNTMQIWSAGVGRGGLSKICVKKSDFTYKVNFFWGKKSLFVSST